VKSTFASCFLAASLTLAFNFGWAADANVSGNLRLMAFGNAA
jgi:hypothetical protein